MRICVHFGDRNQHRFPSAAADPGIDLVKPEGASDDGFVRIVGILPQFSKPCHIRQSRVFHGAESSGNCQTFLFVYGWFRIPAGRSVSPGGFCSGSGFSGCVFDCGGLCSGFPGFRLLFFHGFVFFPGILLFLIFFIFILPGFFYCLFPVCGEDPVAEKGRTEEHRQRNERNGDFGKNGLLSARFRFGIEVFVFQACPVGHLLTPRRSPARLRFLPRRSPLPLRAAGRIGPGILLPPVHAILRCPAILLHGTSRSQLCAAVCAELVFIRYLFSTAGTKHYVPPCR